MKTKIQNRIDLMNRLTALGFTYEEANQLRRIEMTLHRWAELECGDGNDFASWAIERNEPVNLELVNWPDAISNVWLVENRGDAVNPQYTPVQQLDTTDKQSPIARRALRRAKAKNIPGKPYMVTYPHTGKSRRRPVADREKGALKRLDAIIARHPGLVRYQQGDPRGCALYILRVSDIIGHDINSVYTRGVAVCD